MNSINNQQGMSIVSMMVGLVISMIIILATFSFYMKINHYSQSVQTDSKHQGDISFLLLLLQNELQNSGFNLVDGDHFSFDKKDGLYQLYWRYQPLSSSEVVCRSIEEVLIESDGNSDIELQFLTPSNECNATDHLSAMNWGVYDYSAIKFENRSESIMSNIQLTEQLCAPYMIGTIDTQHQLLEIEINSGVSFASHKLSLCLINS